MVPPVNLDLSRGSRLQQRKREREKEKLALKSTFTVTHGFMRNETETGGDEGLLTEIQAPPRFLPSS